MKRQRHKVPGRAVLVRVAPALTVVAGLLALSVRAAAAEGPSAARQIPAPAGVVRLINEYLAAKSAHSPDRTMSFFDRGNTTYVDATLGWKFPTWDSLKALFSKYMPQWPARARSYQTEVLGDAQGAVVFFINAPQEFGHEIRGIAVVDIRNGKFVRWVDYWDGRHFGALAARGVNAIKLNSRGQIVQLTSIWDGSLVTPAWITQHMSLTIESYNPATSA